MGGPANPCGRTPEPPSCAPLPSWSPGSWGRSGEPRPARTCRGFCHLQTTGGLPFTPGGWGGTVLLSVCWIREPRLYCTPGNCRFSRERSGGQASPWASPWALYSLPRFPSVLPRNGGRPGKFAQVATPPRAVPLPRSQHPAGSLRRMKTPELPRSRPEGPSPPPPGEPEAPPRSAGSCGETWRVPRGWTAASVACPPTLCVMWGAGWTTPRSRAPCVKPACVCGPRGNLGAPPRAS